MGFLNLEGVHVDELVHLDKLVEKLIETLELNININGPIDAKVLEKVLEESNKRIEQLENEIKVIRQDFNDFKEKALTTDNVKPITDEEIDALFADIPLPDDTH